MTKTTLIAGLLAVLCLISTLVKAQISGPENELTFHLGSVNGVTNDQMFSPLNYKKDGGAIGINYQRITKRGDLFNALIDLKTLELNTGASSHFMADQLQLNFEAAYLFNVITDNERGCKLFVGADFHSNGNLIVYEDEFTLSNSGSYVSHRGLGFQALRRGSFKKNIINMHFKLPVIGKVYRSPYNLLDKTIDDDQIFSYIYTYGEFGAVHNYFNPSFSATVSRPIIRKWYFTAGYEVNYLKSTVNKPITDFQGRLILATSIKF